MKSAPTLDKEVQSQQKNWKFVGVHQFCPTIGREGVLGHDAGGPPVNAQAFSLTLLLSCNPTSLTCSPSICKLSGLPVWRCHDFMDKGLSIRHDAKKLSKSWPYNSTTGDSEMSLLLPVSGNLGAFLGLITSSYR